MENHPKYRPPSVTLATQPTESKRLAELWLQLKDWKAVGQAAMEEQRFPQKSFAGKQRAIAEVGFRLQHLSATELELLVEQENPEDLRLLLHLAACRAYPFLFSFSRQVLREKLMVYDYEVQDSDFRSHWEENAVHHDSLDRLGETSRIQIRRAIYRFLAEVRVLVGNPPRTLNPVHPPKLLVDGLAGDSRPWLEALLLDDATIGDYLNP